MREADAHLKAAGDDKAPDMVHEDEESPDTPRESSELDPQDQEDDAFTWAILGRFVLSIIRTTRFQRIAGIVFIVVSSISGFLCIGIDEGDIRRGVGSPDGALKLKREFDSPHDFTYSEALDWNQAPTFVELHSEFTLPGRVALCLRDEDSGSSYCSSICESGVEIEKSRFKVEEMRLSPSCTTEEQMEIRVRTLELLKFAIDYVDSERGNASIKEPSAGTYARLSRAPLQSDKVMAAFNKAYSNPLSVREWLRLALVDFHSISMDKLYESAAGSKRHEWNTIGEIRPLFRFGNERRLAKFGVKKFTIDDYGDTLDETVSYEVVEARYDESEAKWVLDNIEVNENAVPIDVDIVMEVGFMVRLTVYAVAFLMGFLFLLFIVKKMVSAFLGGAPEPQKIVIQIEPSGAISGVSDSDEGET